ncbi:MAG: tetratricopeptide repeat protein [Thalassobaculaceae bacterium]
MKRFLAGLVVVSALLGAGSIARAGDYEKGYEAYIRGQFDAARTFWEAAAAAGEVKALNNLAWLYLKGDGVAQDYAVAAEWLRRAAVRGLAVAQRTLGVMYAQGHGVPRDLAAAYMWSKIAAENGNASAGKLQAALAAKLTPAETAEAAARAENCLASDYRDCE